MIDAKRYGAQVRSLRDKRGWTQAQLAKHLGGVSPSAVAQWEKGWTQPSKASLQALARVFEVSVADLMEDSIIGARRKGLELGAAGHTRGLAAPQPQFDEELLRQAAEMGIDVVAELSPHLRASIRLRREARWLEENRAALAEANAFLDRYGLWSDGKRQF